jgi:hypothetical protein
MMENRIPGDIIRVDPSRECLEGRDLIEAMKKPIAPPPNTFGDAFTEVWGRTLRFEEWEIGNKNSFSNTPPESDKEVRGKTQQLCNRTLFLTQGPQAPNLGHHGHKKTRP